jgi:hypothetical protein
MLNSPLIPLPGRRLWCSSDVPTIVEEGPFPFGVGRPVSLSPEVRDYALTALAPGALLQATGHDTRSCYLGRDPRGDHYFAKGVGYCLDPGWTPERGSAGVLPRWAALRERDVGRALAALGIAVSTPVAIWELDELVGSAGTRVRAAEVSEFDGTPSQPSLLIHRSAVRWRLADLAVAPASVREDVRARFWPGLARLAASTAALHAAGGHDHGLGLQSAWIDGARVDFEYVYLPQHPNPVRLLNQNLEVWRSKERGALLELGFHLADLVGLTVSSSELAERWTELVP